MNHEFITPTENTQCQVHVTSEKVQGDVQQCSHTNESRVKNHVPTEKVFPWHIEQFEEENEARSRLSESENAARRALEEQRDHLLAEAKSEVLKQECRADFLNCCIRELQRQIYSNRLEIACANHGCEESRREQSRLHEELAQREKALRETHIGSIHEVEELKRSQKNAN